MLDDRPYMRDTSYRAQWPLTYVLIAINVAMFILQGLLEFYRIFPVTHYLSLSPQGLAHGFVWQLVTFQFLHAGLFHLIMNLIVIYFFGRPLEGYFGRRRFLWLYLGSGVAGGLLQTLLAVLIPQHFGGSVVGASAGAFGLVAAFATLFPDRTLTLLLFFVLPVSMRARTLLWISIALALFGILVPTDNIAHAAHLGGILVGWAFVQFVALGRWRFRFRPSEPRARRRPKVLVRTEANRTTSWSSSAPAEELQDSEFISREVDPILEKISEHGIQSLTEGERKILEKAHSKMRQR